MARECNCVYEEFCKLVNGDGIILPKPCAYRKASENYVEVVRCKDCKWHDEYNGDIVCNHPQWQDAEGWLRVVDADGFCYCEERGCGG